MTSPSPPRAASSAVIKGLPVSLLAPGTAPCASMQTALAGKPTAHKPQCGSSTFLLFTSAMAVPGGFLLSLSPWGMLMAFLCSLVIEQTSCPSRSSHAKSQILSKLHSACRSNVLQELLKAIVSLIKSYIVLEQISPLLKNIQNSHH